MVSALLSTPRSHVSHDHTDTNVPKKKNSKPIRFFTPTQLRVLLSHQLTLPPLRYCFTTVPTHGRVSHALLRCHPAARRGRAGRVRAASTGSVSWSRKKESRAASGAAGGRRGLRGGGTKKTEARREKGEAGRQNNDCGACGRLSGGIRVAGCYRATALPCVNVRDRGARRLLLVLELAEDALEEVSSLLLPSPLRIRGCAVSEVDPGRCPTSACPLRISCSLVFRVQMVHITMTGMNRHGQNALRQPSTHPTPPLPVLPSALTAAVKRHAFFFLT